MKRRQIFLTERSGRKFFHKNWLLVMSQSNLSRHESNHLALDERLKKLFTRGFEYNNLASRAFQKLTQLFQSS